MSNRYGPSGLICCGPSALISGSILAFARAGRQPGQSVTIVQGKGQGYIHLIKGLGVIEILGHRYFLVVVLQI